MLFRSTGVGLLRFTRPGAFITSSCWRVWRPGCLTPRPTNHTFTYHGFAALGLQLHVRVVRHCCRGSGTRRFRQRATRRSPHHGLECAVHVVLSWPRVRRRPGGRPAVAVTTIRPVAVVRLLVAEATVAAAVAPKPARCFTLRTVRGGVCVGLHRLALRRLKPWSKRHDACALTSLHDVHTGRVKVHGGGCWRWNATAPTGFSYGRASCGPGSRRVQRPPHVLLCQFSLLHQLGHRW